MPYFHLHFNPTPTKNHRVIRMGYIEGITPSLERRISFGQVAGFGQVADVGGQCNAGLTACRPVANSRHGGRRGRLATAARTTPTTRDQVTCYATEVGVDDEVENKVDGEVGQQEKVGDVGGRLERPVGTHAGTAATRRQGDEDEQVRRCNEQSEQNDESDQRRRDAVC